MKITREKIDKISAEGRASGVDVRLRDVGYYILEKAFDNSEIAYRMIFDQTALAEEVRVYREGAVQVFVRNWFSKNLNVESVSDDLSFAENKQALIDMLNEITQLAKDGDIPHKDAMKMKADIRVKLNDKFQIQNSEADAIVVVPAKYNYVCPHTNRECYQMTAEYAKKTFNLIDAPDSQSSAE